MREKRVVVQRRRRRRDSPGKRRRARMVGVLSFGPWPLAHRLSQTIQTYLLTNQTRYASVTPLLFAFSVTRFLINTRAVRRMDVVYNLQILAQLESCKSTYIEFLRSAALGILINVWGRTGGRFISSIDGATSATSPDIPCSTLACGGFFAPLVRFSCTVQVGGQVGRHGMEGGSSGMDPCTNGRVASNRRAIHGNA